MTGSAKGRTTEIQSLLLEIERRRRQPFAPTIFSIGGRGYYENATSDVLAFLLDPTREHGLDRAVLDSLLAAANVECTGFTPIAPPYREFATAARNRVDIVFEGERSILVIENKVRHDAVNPFKDYEADIGRSFPDKQAIRLLLGYKFEDVVGWVPVSYREFTKQIRGRLGHLRIDSPNGKWVLLLNEFVETLEQEMKSEELDQADAEFAAANYSVLGDAVNLYYRYLAYVATFALAEVAQALGKKQSEFTTAIHDWGEQGRAIRVYGPRIWGLQSNIALVLDRQGRFSHRIYVYGLLNVDGDWVSARLRGQGTPEYWTESRESIHAAGDRKRVHTDIGTAIELLRGCALRLTALMVDLKDPAGSDSCV